MAIIRTRAGPNPPLHNLYSFVRAFRNRAPRRVTQQRAVDAPKRKQKRIGATPPPAPITSLFKVTLTAPPFATEQYSCKCPLHRHTKTYLHKNLQLWNPPWAVSPGSATGVTPRSQGRLR